MGHWGAATEVYVRRLLLTTFGDGDTGGRVRGGRGMCTKEAEYGRSVHCNVPNSVPLRGNGADYRYLGC